MQNIDLIIDKIMEVRAKNNQLWMGLLRIAFKASPEESGVLLQSIHDNDIEVSRLILELKETIIYDDDGSKKVL